MSTPKERNYISFKFAKNRCISFSNDYRPIIPCRIVRGPNKDGIEILQPFHDLDHVHKMPLPDTSVLLPKRDPEVHDDELWAAIRAEAVRLAIEARRQCAQIKREIEAYVASGTLTVVEGPSGLLEEPTN